ncbi:MAG TPA: arsenate reductase (glutaredoxin) [Azospirillaceae bacterium]|nr:arsenate reductase (glutaredoxin) [Azospirillaceae bacterium]
MTVTIWHNPNCSTSRKVLEALRGRGLEPAVVEYLKTPPDRAALTSMLERMGAKPSDILRRRGNDELLAGGPDDQALLELMLKHPVLIERPIVATPKGAVLCRPAERLEEVL